MNNPGLTPCKVVLLGESGVGKTSIISRFINNKFDSDSMATTGANYMAKSINFENLDKIIWDTAGQEKFRALTKIFYKDANVAILVYDITRRDSFKEIKDYWYNQIKENAAKKIVVAIAANKSDLCEEGNLDEAEAKQFAKEINAVFKCTSAKSASGIEAIGNKFIDPNYEEELRNEETEDDKKRKQTIKIKSTPENNQVTQNKKGCC